ncbi:murein hydrolase activator EnvC [Orbaceae bacterium ESL0721]|nr:murein hydrolase activator EnvC [Orbaceae bacterium ESL0721]
MPTLLHADDTAQLKSIRRSIQEQESKLTAQRDQRAKLLESLKNQETAIAELSASIDKNSLLLKKFEGEIKTLIKQITLLQSKQLQQRTALAKQLEAAFKLGKTTGLDLIFSGVKSERNERIITYYGYINEARETQINDLKETQLQLNEKKTTLESRRTKQKTVQDRQQKEQAGLEKSRQDRQKTIAALESSMQANQLKLSELRSNERKLQAQIAKAEKESRRLTREEIKRAKLIKDKQKSSNYTPNADERSLMARVSGIGKPQKQFNWPVSGTLLHRFNEPLQGELRWKGLVINAKDGTPVKAITNGRVILASWLQGYGFIVALEHGKNDMSLYGYNQRLLVNVGDTVEAGQPIALVGASGGQSAPALYFEIRRDGKALDPSAWLK